MQNNIVGFFYFSPSLEDFFTLIYPSKLLLSIAKIKLPLPYSTLETFLCNCNSAVIITYFRYLSSLSSTYTAPQVCLLVGTYLSFALPFPASFCP